MKAGSKVSVFVAKFLPQFLFLSGGVLSTFSLHAEDSTRDQARAFFHLPISHNDGLGDVMFARELAEQLQTRRPGADFPVIIEDKIEYQALQKTSDRFDRNADSNRILGVEFVLGQSPRAREIMASASSRITYLPAAVSSTRFDWGDSQFNLYYDEPGVPLIDMEYAAPLPRGKVIHRADRQHLRIHPGFATKDHGVALPNLGDPSPSLKRTEILNLLSRRGLNLDPEMAGAKWAVAYSHSQLGRDSLLYYLALTRALKLKRLVGPVVVFDFSEGHKKSHDEIFGPPDFFGRFRRRSSQILLPNQSERWVGRRSVRSLTIVRVGAVPHDLFVELMKQADLPIAVTGTQSLFEAISLRKPFYYEFVPWNMNLIFGLAEFAALHYQGDEKFFLISWLTGRSDITSVEDVRRLMAEYGLRKINLSIDIHHFISTLIALMGTEEYQALVREFLGRVNARADLADRMSQCLDQLTRPK